MVCIIESCYKVTINSITILSDDNLSVDQIDNLTFYDNLTLYFDNNTHADDNWTQPYYISIKANNDNVRDGDNESLVFFQLEQFYLRTD